jgi:16S rRNA (cytosine967-C5)-methyltransferase
LVRSGGTLVYSTCSIFPDENELQVQEFLKTHSEFILEAEQMLYPSGEGDGFYMARLKRQ